MSSELLCNSPYDKMTWETAHCQCRTIRPGELKGLTRNMVSHGVVHVWMAANSKRWTWTSGEIQYLVESSFRYIHKHTHRGGGGGGVHGEVDRYGDQLLYLFASNKREIRHAGTSSQMFFIYYSNFCLMTLSLLQLLQVQSYRQNRIQNYVDLQYQPINDQGPIS